MCARLSFACCVPLGVTGTSEVQRSSGCLMERRRRAGQTPFSFLGADETDLM